MLREWQVSIHGEPKAKGSVRAYTFKRKGGGPPGARVEHAKSALVWQEHVTRVLVAERPNWLRPERGIPVHLNLVFWLKAPQVVERKWSKKNIERAHVTAPDIDKLVRTIADAGTGLLWADDSQIVFVAAEKKYALGRPMGVDMTVRYLQPERAVDLF